MFLKITLEPSPLTIKHIVFGLTQSTDSLEPYVEFEAKTKDWADRLLIHSHKLKKIWSHNKTLPSKILNSDHLFIIYIFAPFCSFLCQKNRNICQIWQLRKRLLNIRRNQHQKWRFLDVLLLSQTLIPPFSLLPLVFIILPFLFLLPLLNFLLLFILPFLFALINP